MEYRTAEISGVPMRWIEHGDGFPVVLVHGFPTSARLWREVQPLVRGRTLAWELIGYGGGMRAAKDRGIGVGAQADYLLAWLDAMQIERAVFAGHEIGGGVVQIAAVRRPEICAGLVLADSVFADSWPIASIKALRRAHFIARIGFKRRFARVIEHGHDDRARARQSIDEHWPFYAAAGGVETFLRQIESPDPADTQQVAGVGSLRVPSRVVWGENDPYQTVGYGERLARELDTTVDRIAGAKHFTPEDHPDRIAAAIHDVLDEAEAASKPKRPAPRRPKATSKSRAAAQSKTAKKKASRRPSR